jgi:Uncharacterized conserved protein
MNHLQRHLRVSDYHVPHLKVAFASSDMKTVDQHFGSCESLLVYGVEPDGYELLQVAEFQVVEGHLPAKVASRIEVIEGCFAVYCNAVGEAVFRQLMAAGIRAIRVEHGTSITSLIQSLQDQWPQRIPQKQRQTDSADSLADALEDAGWDE